VNFAFNEAQEQLRESVRDYLTRETPVSYARAMLDDAAGFTEPVWRSLAALGWVGLNIPEEFGGSGLGTLELVLLLEEMGAVVFPAPYFSTVCLGVEAVSVVASNRQKQAILPAVAEGRRRLTLAVAEVRGSWEASHVELTAAPVGDDYTLSGTKLFVPDARSADTIIVVTRLGEGLGFFAVPRDGTGVRVEPMVTVDQTRKIDVVELRDVRVRPDALLGGASMPFEKLDAIIDHAKTALAAEMCGAAATALTLSVDYVKIRKQFGRPIGSFQAIQHKLADMKVSLETARSLVYYAGWALDTGAEDARLAAAMAKAYAGDACMRVIADAIQAHGGIGFTWEHDLHLYFKRVEAGALSYGGATTNRELVAQLLNL
jgi:alkylation response protein AidB-like acyl-CoA dehydrogenase